MERIITKRNVKRRDKELGDGEGRAGEKERKERWKINTDEGKKQWFRGKEKDDRDWTIKGDDEENEGRPVSRSIITIETFSHSG